MKESVSRDRPRENILMERTEKPLCEALSWLQYVLNSETEMPTVSDWPALFAFAEKQAIIGICLPEKCPENLPKDILIHWIGQIQFIEHQNRLLNRRVLQLFGMLERDGFQCCLLKGQGNAMMYPNHFRRCSGDIDVWVNADEETAYQYVKRLFPSEKKSFKHFHFPIFKDVPVDVHVTPLKFYCGTYRKRLERWIARNKSEQFNHKIAFVETYPDICVPTRKFNIVYQLGHMLRHLFDEGLGLRQVVDYFYVLKNLYATEKEREDLVAIIKSLGMFRFAQAVMWIESDVLGLPVVRCLVEPNEKMGRLLLNDILEGGNFGHYTQRYNGKTGVYYMGLVHAMRNIKLLRFAPMESVTHLFYKIGTAITYPINGRK